MYIEAALARNGYHGPADVKSKAQTPPGVNENTSAGYAIEKQSIVSKGLSEKRGKKRGRKTHRGR